MTMGKTIDYVCEIDLATKQLKDILNESGYLIKNEKEIQNAIKFYCEGEVNVILYFSKGKSSKIVIEKGNEELEAKLEKISMPKEQRFSRIPIYATYTVSAKNQLKIREEIEKKFHVIEIEKKAFHVNYILNITRDNESLTVTQFNSGKILLQGTYSSLVSEIKEIINIFEEISDKEEALTFVPESQKETFEEAIENLDDRFKVFCEETKRKLSSEAYDYLWTNDKKQIVTAFGLLYAIKEQQVDLPLYNPIVYPVLKAFEGFLIKMMIDKNAFTLEDYKNDTGVAKIGSWLHDKEFEKYIKDKKRYGYINNNLLSAWKGGRCGELHSDLGRKESISDLLTVDMAETKISAIIDCIREAYGIIIKEGYTYTELQENNDDVKIKAEKSVTLLDNKRVIRDIPLLDNHIGTDESGKGDYFGPLVVAGVFVTSEDEDRLRSIGVRDSKHNSDRRNIDLANQITSLLGQSKIAIITIRPERYNSLYIEMGKNLNKILAWGHSRAIEDLLVKQTCNNVIADQFGDESFIKNALLKNGKNIQLLQTPKAERDIAVAAASILARAKFLEELDRLSKIAGIQLLKGANSAVEDVARKLVEKKLNKDFLKNFAKYHFKTTDNI